MVAAVASLTRPAMVRARTTTSPPSMLVPAVRDRGRARPNATMKVSR